MYAIATVHLNFFWALQVSHPDTQAHIRVPHMQCVGVCVHTHIQHINIKPLSKMGGHFPRPNESLTLKTSANRRPAGKNPLTALLHTHTMVFKTPVNSAENTCWAHIHGKKMTTTKWIKTMTETTSTTTTARRKLMQTFDGPALLPSVGSKQAPWAPPILQPTTSLSPSQPRNSSWFFSAVPHHDPALLPDSGSAILADVTIWAPCSPCCPYVAVERQEAYSGVEYNVPFREESCRNSCIYIGPLHSCSYDTVQPAFFHLRWCRVNPADLKRTRITSTEQPRFAISVSSHFFGGSTIPHTTHCHCVAYAMHGLHYSTTWEDTHLCRHDFLFKHTMFIKHTVVYRHER